MEDYIDGVGKTWTHHRVGQCTDLISIVGPCVVGHIKDGHVAHK